MHNAIPAPLSNHAIGACQRVVSGYCSAVRWSAALIQSVTKDSRLTLYARVPLGLRAECFERTGIAVLSSARAIGTEATGASPQPLRIEGSWLRYAATMARQQPRLASATCAAFIEARASIRVARRASWRAASPVLRASTEGKSPLIAERLSPCWRDEAACLGRYHCPSSVFPRSHSILQSADRPASRNRREFAASGVRSWRGVRRKRGPSTKGAARRGSCSIRRDLGRLRYRVVVSSARCAFAERPVKEKLSHALSSDTRMSQAQRFIDKNAAGKFREIMFAMCGK